MTSYIPRHRSRFEPIRHGTRFDPVRHASRFRVPGGELAAGVANDLLINASDFLVINGAGDILEVTSG